jgi:hypothetical protein
MPLNLNSNEYIHDITAAGFCPCRAWLPQEFDFVEDNLGAVFSKKAQ